MQFLRIGPAAPLQLLQTGQKTLITVFQAPMEATSANLRFTPLFTWSGGPNVRITRGQGPRAWLGVVGLGDPGLGPGVLFGTPRPPKSAPVCIFGPPKSYLKFLLIFDRILIPKMLPKAAQNGAKIDQKDL